LKIEQKNKYTKKNVDIYLENIEVMLTKDKIRKSFKCLKNHKAAGVDEINSTMLKEILDGVIGVFTKYNI